MMRNLLAAAIVSLSVNAGAVPAALAEGGYKQSQSSQASRGQQATSFQVPAMVQALVSGEFTLSADQRLAARQTLYMLGFAVALDRAWEFLDADASDQALALLRDTADEGLPARGIGREQARNLLRTGGADAEAFARIAAPNSPAARRVMRQLAAGFDG